MTKSFVFRFIGVVLYVRTRVVYMRYAYDEKGRIITGVIFFFNKDDDEIMRKTFEFIGTVKQSPTIIGIDCTGCSFTSSEVLRRLNKPNGLDHADVGVKFTVYDAESLKSYLEFLRKSYPVLLSLADEVERNVLGTRH